MKRKIAVFTAIFLAVTIISAISIYYSKEYTHHYEAGALASLGALHVMQENYKADKGGYASNFTDLGIPLGASLHNDELNWDGGYSYRLCDIRRDTQGVVIAYAISARPLRYQHGSRNSYLEEQDGRVFMTQEDRAANQHDELIPH